MKLAVLLMIATLFIGSGCMRRDSDSDGIGQEQAIAEAKRAFAAKQAQGEDFSNGPCIAEEAIEDWAVDVAHDPRQDVDDLPENQCQSYRDGQTHHFVELDPEGNLIRAQ